MLLHWVSQPSATEVDIAPTLDDLVEVVSLSRQGRHRLAIKTNPMPPFDPESHKAYAVHRIELVAFAEGADSVSEVMEYGFTPSGGVSITDSERPPHDRTQALGLLGMLTTPDEIRMEDDSLE